ncbi:hypothetical protein DQ04_01081010 [Trypanosoma grayi]|uniref:hypothetical protein n=1 Tax=Trypanosoma grayi TaxID=71804 RepID=UPI0004F47D2E|nr:hypothetical protein DQ04_01081010 [Trypanosoma grayi]KEG13308.1 hypothetical protein DQ04_01081010 [Trypanosoma grayi]
MTEGRFGAVTAVPRTVRLAPPMNNNSVPYTAMQKTALGVSAKQNDGNGAVVQELDSPIERWRRTRAASADARSSATTYSTVPASRVTSTTSPGDAPLPLSALNAPNRQSYTPTAGSQVRGITTIIPVSRPSEKPRVGDGAAAMNTESPIAKWRRSRASSADPRRVEIASSGGRRDTKVTLRQNPTTVSPSEARASTEVKARSGVMDPTLSRGAAFVPTTTTAPCDRNKYRSTTPLGQDGGWKKTNWEDSTETKVDAPPPLRPAPTSVGSYEKVSRSPPRSRRFSGSGVDRRLGSPLLVAPVSRDVQGANSDAECRVLVPSAEGTASVGRGRPPSRKGERTNWRQDPTWKEPQFTLSPRYSESHGNSRTASRSATPRAYSRSFSNSQPLNSEGEELAGFLSAYSNPPKVPAEIAAFYDQDPQQLPKGPLIPSHTYNLARRSSRSSSPKTTKYRLLDENEDDEADDTLKEQLSSLLTSLEVYQRRLERAAALVNLERYHRKRN